MVSLFTTGGSGNAVNAFLGGRACLMESTDDLEPVAVLDDAKVGASDIWFKGLMATGLDERLSGSSRPLPTGS